MLLKKAGMVTVGVAATLFAAAPLASASECHDDGGHRDHESSSRHGDCSFLGGTGEGSSGGDANGELAGIAGAAVGGIGGNNVGNIADCSSFLNHNLDGNQVLSNNSLSL